MSELQLIRDVLFEFHLKFWNTASIGIPVRRDIITEQKFGKRKMADSDFNFFFKNPKYPLGNPPFCLWNHQKWFWGPKIAPLSFSQKF